MKRRQLLTEDDARPATRQHRAPCSDCPWARTALPGWLGPNTAAEWLQCAHGEAQIPCHTRTGAQCAGSAIYRANVVKLPRDPQTLRLPADETRVFGSPAEFTRHHGEDK